MTRSIVLSKQLNFFVSWGFTYSHFNDNAIGRVFLFNYHITHALRGLFQMCGLKYVGRTLLLSNGWGNCLIVTIFYSVPYILKLPQYKPLLSHKSQQILFVYRRIFNKYNQLYTKIAVSRTVFYITRFLFKTKPKIFLNFIFDHNFASRISRGLSRQTQNTRKFERYKKRKSKLKQTLRFLYRRLVRRLRVSTRIFGRSFKVLFFARYFYCRRFDVSQASLNVYPYRLVLSSLRSRLMGSLVFRLLNTVSFSGTVLRQRLYRRFVTKPVQKYFKKYTKKKFKFKRVSLVSYRLWLLNLKKRLKHADKKFFRLRSQKKFFFTLLRNLCLPFKPLNLRVLSRKLLSSLLLCANGRFKRYLRQYKLANYRRNFKIYYITQLKKKTRSNIKLKRLFLITKLRHQLLKKRNRRFYRLVSGRPRAWYRFVWFKKILIGIVGSSGECGRQFLESFLKRMRAIILNPKFSRFLRLKFEKLVYTFFGRWHIEKFLTIRPRCARLLPPWKLPQFILKNKRSQQPIEYRRRKQYMPLTLAEKKHIAARIRRVVARRAGNRKVIIKPRFYKKKLFFIKKSRLKNYFYKLPLFKKRFLNFYISRVVTSLVRLKKIFVGTLVFSKFRFKSNFTCILRLLGQLFNNLQFNKAKLRIICGKLLVMRRVCSVIDSTLIINNRVYRTNKLKNIFLKMSRRLKYVNRLLERKRRKSGFNFRGRLSIPVVRLVKKRSLFFKKRWFRVLRRQLVRLRGRLSRSWVSVFYRLIFFNFAYSDSALCVRLMYFLRSRPRVLGFFSKKKKLSTSIPNSVVARYRARTMVQMLRFNRRFRGILARSFLHPKKRLFQKKLKNFTNSVRYSARAKKAYYFNLVNSEFRNFLKNFLKNLTGFSNIRLVLREYRRFNCVNDAELLALWFSRTFRRYWRFRKRWGSARRIFVRIFKKTLKHLFQKRLWSKSVGLKKRNFLSIVVVMAGRFQKQQRTATLRCAARLRRFPFNRLQANIDFGQAFYSNVNGASSIKVWVWRKGLLKY